MIMDFDNTQFPLLSHTYLSIIHHMINKGGDNICMGY